MKSVLITGANRGIGLELTRQYAAEKWQVIACCRKPEQAIELQNVAQEAYVQIVALDVTDKSQIDSLSQQLGRHKIDIIINNAGIYGPQDISLNNIDDNAWLETFKTNVIAPMAISAALVDNVATSQLKIIAAVSSILGSIENNIDGGRYIYRSSKTALNSAFKALAIDLKKQGISVILLHPGWVKTDMGGRNAPIEPTESAKQIKKLLDSVTLKQSGMFLSYDGSKIPW